LDHLWVSGSELAFVELAVVPAALAERHPTRCGQRIKLLLQPTLGVLPFDYVYDELLTLFAPWAHGPREDWFRSCARGIAFASYVGRYHNATDYFFRFVKGWSFTIAQLALIQRLDAACFSFDEHFPAFGTFTVVPGIDLCDGGLSNGGNFTAMLFIPSQAAGVPGSIAARICTCGGR